MADTFRTYSPVGAAYAPVELKRRRIEVSNQDETEEAVGGGGGSAAETPTPGGAVVPTEKDEGAGAADKQPRVRRKMAVLLLSYSGTGYNGMQIQPTKGTIENELFDAMLKVGIISEENHERVQSAQFQRCARTDKGVHAARQVVSLKLAVDTPDIPGLLNAVLPRQIRVQAFMRAPRSFNAKNQCTGRRYQYLAPSYAFAPKGELTEDSLAYRVSAEELANINAVLKRFVGTHNYHNFTSRKKHSDPSAKRFIVSFVCEGPIVLDGIEFVRLNVCGQSFLLHMIRKMVGLTMAIVRGYTDISVMDRAFGSAKVDVPRAPGLGLLLDACMFDVYNNKYKGDPEHPPMGWPELDEKIEEFKRDVIFAEMVQTERTERVIFNWLQTVGNHNYDATDAQEDEEGDDDDDDDGKAESGAGPAKTNQRTTSESAESAPAGPKKIRPWGKRNFKCYSYSCKERGSAQCYSVGCRTWVNPWPSAPKPEESTGEAQQGGSNKRKKWNPRGAGSMKWRKRPKK